MHKHLSIACITLIENAIHRLSLPVSHPSAFPLNQRLSQFQSIIDSLVNLFQCSVIDLSEYDRLSERAFQAYINGGL